MISKRLLSVVAAIPLVMAGCSSLHSDGSQSGGYSSRAGGATTSGAGNYGNVAGADVPLTADEINNDVVFYFDFDHSDINDKDFITLQRHAKYLSTHSQAKIRVEGHTDERGSREYNVALGERRSQSLSRVLRLEGVPKEQVAVVSFGEEKPAVQGHDESSWQRNRRGIIVYEAS